MKVLLLTDRLAIGGAETHIAVLLHELRRRGVAAEVGSAGGPYAERLTREGVRHHTLPFTARSPWGLCAAVRRLAALLQSGQYDLVHAHARVPAFLAEPLCRRLHIPMVTTAHWVFRADGWRGRLSRWGDHTLAVSADIQEYLLHHYPLTRDQISLTCNGIEEAIFYPRPGGPACRGRLLHISRLDKGRAAAAAALIHLAPRLAARGAAQLTIVGDGNAYEALHKEATAVNRALGFPFLHMPGSVEEVAPLLRENDIFIGVSRAALEAMACGLPTILAGDEGYLSLLTPAVTDAAEACNYCCRGAPPLEEEHLLRDISLLLADSEMQQRMGAFAVSYIRTHYTAERMGEDALRAYRLVLKRPSPPVIICGYYGFENMGDEAVLSHTIRLLRKEGYTEIGVLSAAPQKTAAAHGVTAYQRTALSAIRKNGKRGGIFLLGGGNLLQNETSDRSLSYYIAMLRFASRCGCRVWLMGGIGKLRGRGEKRVAAALKKVERFFARTPQDAAYCRRLCGEKLPVQLLPDGALWARPAKALPPALPSAPFLLLALRGNTPAPTLHAMIEAGVSLAKAYDITPVFACLHETQDNPLARRTVAALPQARLLPPMQPEVLIALLKANGRAVLATRLHALIFAAVAGVPAVTQEDGGKISHFAAYAAACSTEEAPMLLSCGTPNAIRPALHRVLEKPPCREQKRRYLAALRRGNVANDKDRLTKKDRL